MPKTADNYLRILAVWARIIGPESGSVGRGVKETDDKENRMQLATPLTMLSGVLRNAGLECGRSIANAQAGIDENLPIDQLLIVAVSLCSQSANPKGYGPVDVIGRRYDIHGEFD